MKRAKDKTLAAVLSFFGGTIGLHRFYLGQRGLGIFMIVLTFFTMGLLTALISLIDAIAFFTMDQEVFDMKYNSPKEEDEGRSQYKGKRPYKQYRERPDYQRRRTTMYRQEGEKTSPAASKYKRKSRRSRKPGVQVNKKRKKEKYRELLVRLKKHKTSGIEKFKDYDFEGAIRSFKKVLQIDAGNVAAHFNIACAYSQIEQSHKSMFHISEAVKNGFNDFEKIKNHEKLAFARIQPNWEEFSANNFILKKEEEERVIVKDNPQEPDSDENIEKKKESKTYQGEKNSGLEGEELFSSLKRLKEQREKGIISDTEFETERRKLMS